MNTLVLDSGAMIAFLRREKGWDVVADALADKSNTCCAHAAQMAEVMYDCIRVDGDARALELVGDLSRNGVGISQEMDDAFWHDIARLKAGINPSFADCFGLALTRRLGGIFLSTDRHELDNDEVKALCPVSFIR